jgi:outer membrane biosynthesis protein TonB
VPFDPVQVVDLVESHRPSASVAAGTVIVKVVVNQSGTASCVEAVHGIPSLTEEVELTVKKWKFQPVRGGRYCVIYIVGRWKRERRSRWRA